MIKLKTQRTKLLWFEWQLHLTATADSITHPVFLLKGWKAGFHLLSDLRSRSCSNRFLPGCGNVDKLFSFAGLLQQPWEFSHQVYMCFVALEMTFDHDPQESVIYRPFFNLVLSSCNDQHLQVWGNGTVVLESDQDASWTRLLHGSSFANFSICNLSHSCKALYGNLLITHNYESNNYKDGWR